MIADTSDLERVLRYARDGGAYFDFIRCGGGTLDMATPAEARAADVPEGVVTIQISATLFSELLDAWMVARERLR